MSRLVHAGPDSSQVVRPKRMVSEPPDVMRPIASPWDTVNGWSTVKVGTPITPSRV